MPADSSYYTGRKLNHSDPNAVVTEHHEALYLGLTKAQLMERFYLDYVQENLEDGIVGFLGACEVGSPNYELHNTARVGMILFLAESVPGNSDWRQYKAYMDGGINTKGKAVILQIKTTHVNHIKIAATFRSSYLETSTEWGFEYKTLTGNWQRVNMTTGPLPPDTLLNFTDVLYTALEDAQSVSVRPYIINPEGFYPGAIASFSGTIAISHIGALHRTSDPCSAAGEQAIDLYIRNDHMQQLATIPEQSTVTGIYGYLDDEFTVPIPDGYYWALVPGKSLWVVAGQFIMSMTCAITPTVDFNVYIGQEAEGGYFVSINLTQARAGNVTVIGRIASYNAMDQEISGGTGDSNFIITVNAGDMSASRDEMAYFPAPDAAYIKCVISSTNPSGLSYNSYPG